MKTPPRVPTRKILKFVVDQKDPRLATVRQADKVLFTLRTDTSGLHPALIVVAAETYLKSMEKGKTGLAIWNGTAGLPTRNLRLA